MRTQIKTLHLSDAGWKSFISEDENCDRCKIETTQLHSDSMIGYCEITCLDCGLVWNELSDYGIRLKRRKLRNNSLESVNWVRTEIDMKPLKKLGEESKRRRAERDIIAKEEEQRRRDFLNEIVWSV